MRTRKFYPIAPLLPSSGLPASIDVPVEERVVPEPRWVPKNEDHSEQREMDELAREKLVSEGFKIVGIVDDGQMREAYHVRQRLGEAQHDYLAKVPKQHIDVGDNSLQTRIAYAKPVDWEKREVRATNRFNHPNVARVHRTFQLEDGRQINLEEFTPGSVNLRRKIEKTGPLGGRIFRSYLEGFVNGLQHIHSQGFAHGDIKPENAVIVSDEERPMWVDFQTTENIWAGYSTLATRGSINYTTEDVINGVFNRGSNFRATRQHNDIFGLGGVTYFMLTGEDPGQLSMEVDPQSQTYVELNDGTKVPFTLSDKGTPLREGLTSKHGKDRLKGLEKKMREHRISKPYRDFVIRCMLPEKDKRAFRDMNEVAEAYKRLDLDPVQRFKERAGEEALRGVKMGLLTALGLGIPTFLGGSCYYMIKTDFLDSQPSFPIRHDMHAIMNMERHNDFDIPGLPKDERIGAFRTIAANLDDVLDRLPQVEKTDAWKWLDFEHSIGYADNIRAINKRLAASLIRTCALYDRPEILEAYKIDGQERIPHSLSPKSFHPKWFDDEELKGPPTSRFWPHGITYLRDCITHDYEVADTFARYFAGEEQMRKAMVASDSTTYFPRIDEDGKETTPGYGGALPKYMRDMISTAVLLYHCSSEEDQSVNWQRMKYLARQYGPGAKPSSPDPFTRWEGPAYAPHPDQMWQQPIFGEDETSGGKK